MAAHKGQISNPKGRGKGTPNKATAEARIAIKAFVDGNVDRLNGWLDAIADKDPKDAFNCYMSVLEYNIPKLARQEQTGEGGGPVKHIFQWMNPPCAKS